MPAIKTKRVWDPHDAADGARFLIDGRWPPGARHDSLRIVLWIREAAPSRKLMKWFGGQAGRWSEFKSKYFSELNQNPGAWEPIARQARLGQVTLIYASKNRKHNNAVALAEYLNGTIGSG